LYKEDFEKFTEGLNDAIGFITDNNVSVPQTSAPESYTASATTENETSTWSNVEFDDLDGKA
jgi:hypothetical protein